MTDSSQPTQTAKERDEALRNALRVGGFVAFEADFETVHIVLSDISDGVLSIVSGPQEQFLNHIVDEDRGVIGKVFQNIRTTGVAQGAEVRYVWADGNVTRLDVRMRASRR